MQGVKRTGMVMDLRYLMMTGKVGCGGVDVDVGCLGTGF
jgi:hypothetical protein